MDFDEYTNMNPGDSRIQNEKNACINNLNTAKQEFLSMYRQFLEYFRQPSLFSHLDTLYEKS